MRRRIAANIAQYGTEAEWLADLDRAQAFGMWGVRLDIVPVYTRNGLDLSAPAAKIAAARARGLKVHAMLPHWLTVDKIQQKTGEALSTLATFTAAVVKTLGAEIASYELGNEPNLQHPFAPDGADPEYQAAVTAAMVKNLPPKVHVCSPGLAPANDGDGTLSPLSFSKRYWAALDTVTRARLNGVGIHLYGSPADIAQPWSTYGQLAAISTVAGGKPFDVTEFNGDPTRPLSVIAVQAQAGLAWLAKPPVPINRVYVYTLSSNDNYGAYGFDGVARPLAGVLESWHS